MAPETLVLTRREVAELLPIADAIAAVEAAFRALGEPGARKAQVLHLPAGDGGFHVKSALLALGLDRRYFAAKVNANFPGNPERWGLPLVQGVVVLADAERGTPLALLDSMELTALRTAAATAVAARWLARENARVLTLVGCGAQAAAQLRAVAEVRRLERVLVFDVDGERARAFAAALGAELRIDVAPASDLATALRSSDLCVTCTPSRRPLVLREHVAAGAFVAGVGADHPEKQELDPGLLAAATVVVDDLDQCAAFGDLHHALAAGALRREDVYAELAEVVCGRKRGRRSAEEIVVFDSTGVAATDVAAAAVVYERARATGAGLRVSLGG